MLLNNIDFPNEILEAINTDNLVIFAGAGVSVDPPTSLPNFSNLANKIAEGTGKKVVDIEHCEVFLGDLKASGVDVNRLAANIISDKCSMPNEMHEIIIGLFRNPLKIKIVTTNYDQMFERVIEDKSIDLPIYNAPSLPLGDDVSGIIHVHGNVNNPKYMVVTDEDFGKAYLTEGYATRFLAKLFCSYTILFVGYSYKDTIVRYLSRAMARTKGAKRFILTDDDSSNWENLGITPVLFPKSEYSTLREGLKKIGNRTKRGLIEWKGVLEGFSEKPPKDFSMDTEIGYCLIDKTKAKILSDCIHGEEWLVYLNNKRVFDNLFTSTGELSSLDLIWQEWLTREFVGTNDFFLKQLLMQKGNKLHPAFALAMVRELLFKKNKVKDDILQEYVILLDPFIEASSDIYLLIELLSERKLYIPCKELFGKYYSYKFILEKQSWRKEQMAYRLSFKGEYYYIEKSWERCKSVFAQKYADQWMSFIKNLICEIYEKYLVINKNTETGEPWEMVMLIIENREGRDDKNPLTLLSDIFCQCCKMLASSRPVFAVEFLSLCLNESSTLLRKIALKALRELDNISPNKKFDVFMNNSPIAFFGGKEQIFLLIKSIFDNLSEDRKNKLVDSIEKLGTYSGERSNEYEKYNWCVWIKRFCKDNERINKLEEDILSRNEFEPRQYPELDMYVSKATWVEEISPISQTEMMQLGIEKIIDYLNDYASNGFEGPSRQGLLNQFSQCCKSSYVWSVRIARSLIEKKVNRSDVWNHLLQGIKDSDASVEDRIELLLYLTNNIEQVDAAMSLARLMLSTLEKEEIDNHFNKYEERLIIASEKIAEKRETDYFDNLSLIDVTMNSTLGTVLLCYIRMLSYCDRYRLPNDYKKIWG